MRHLPDADADEGEGDGGAAILSRRVDVRPRHRLLEHAPAGGEDGAEVEAHRAVGDPLEVVRELLRHRRLVAAPHLREAGEAGADDEPLPVRGQLVRELLEEDGADGSRADEAHVAAQDVPELRDLVQLRRLQPLAERRELLLGAPHELLAEVRAEARLGVGLQRPELQHEEDAPAAPDALAAVEDRAAARREQDERDRDGERKRDDEEERREDDVEQAQEDVSRSGRRSARQLAVAADEGVLGHELDASDLAGEGER